MKNDKIWCVTNMTQGKLRWQVKFEWFGWSRIIGFAIMTNLSRPAGLIFIAGWQIHFGRLPVITVTTMEIK